MRTSAKLIMFLAVLAIYSSVQGEILIYSKTIKGFAAEGEGVTNPRNPNIVNWNWVAGERVERGFLILDVEIGPNAHITGINKAMQVEYWKDGREKYYEQTSYNFEIERIEVDDTAYWILRDIFAPEEDQVLIFMVEGKTRMNNIGLGSKENQREIPLTLTGSVLTFLYDNDEYLHFIYKEILTVSLRLHKRWTRLANSYWEIYDPFIDDYNPFEWAEGGINQDGQPYGIVKEWLIRRGYMEAEDAGQHYGNIDDGEQDDGDDNDDDDSGDENWDGIIWFP